VLYYESGSRWFDPGWCHWNFSLAKSFRSHYGLWVDSASNRNEYQEYFLGSKGGRCVRLTTLPPSCAVVTKSGNLNFLEPSGSLQACNGTAVLTLKSRGSSSDVIIPSKMSWPGHITGTAEKRNAYSSVSQPSGRGPLPGPSNNYTGPREVLLEFAISVF